MKYTIETFTKSARAIHGDKFTYKDLSYNKDNALFFTLTCCTCGKDTSMKVWEHLHNKQRGCKHCALEERHSARRTPISELIVQMHNIHSNRYEYCISEETYSGRRGKITIKCKCGHVFDQKIGSHMEGKGCPKCRSKGIDYTKAAIMYYVSINNGAYYKIGITTKNVKQRFRYEPADIKVLKTWDYPIGKEALKAEQTIIQTHKSCLTSNKPLVDGNTEVFTIDILGLDE